MVYYRSFVLCLIKNSNLLYVMLYIGLYVVCIFSRIQRKVLKYFPCGRVDVGTMYANMYRNYRILVCVFDLCEILFKNCLSVHSLDVSWLQVFFVFLSFSLFLSSFLLTVWEIKPRAHDAQHAFWDRFFPSLLNHVFVYSLRISCSVCWLHSLPLPNSSSSCLPSLPIHIRVLSRCLPWTDK